MQLQLNIQQTQIRFYRVDREYGEFSNLWPASIKFEEREFKNAEFAYQFGKFKDPVIAEWAMQAPKPHLVAILAHNLFVWDIVPNWTAIKVTRMENVLRAKYAQHEDLKTKLLATHPAILMEDSKTDNFWGLGKKGTGRNMLGVLLMKIREELKGEHK